MRLVREKRTKDSAPARRSLTDSTRGRSLPSSLPPGLIAVQVVTEAPPPPRGVEGGAPRVNHMAKLLVNNFFRR